MNKMLSFVGGLFGRSWAMPLVVGVGSVFCAVMVGIISHMTVEATLVQRQLLGNQVACFLFPQLLLFVLLPAWLLIRSIVLLVRKRAGIGEARLWSVPTGFVAFVCLFASSFHVNMGCYDTFADAHKLPESMTPENTPDMAVPVGMMFFNPLDGTPMPPVVQKWKELCELDYSLSVDDSEVLTEQTPNAEKLAAVAPELLAEYKLRAFCHRALSPGYRAPAYLDLLVHPEETDVRGRRWDIFSRMDFLWSKELSNGWKVSITCGKDEFGKAAPDCFDCKRMKLLEEALAPLVANPTRDGLDALVPPLPNEPVLVLHAKGQPGIYRPVLVVPLSFPEGTFSVKAEVQAIDGSLSKLQLPKLQFHPVPYRKVCRTAECEPFTVYSGEWGEYYASVWSLYFTPSAGGTPRLVNRQLYLMQGWSR